MHLNSEEVGVPRYFSEGKSVQESLGISEYNDTARNSKCKRYIQKNLLLAHNNSPQPRACFPTMFFQQARELNHHAPIHRFAHIVQRQCRD